MKKSRPTSLKEVLEGALPPQVSRRMAGGQVKAAWREAVGEHIAAKAKPVGLDQKGRLVVAVSGSAWQNELKMLEPEIVAKLGQAGLEIPGLKFTEPAAPVKPPKKIVLRDDPVAPEQAAELEKTIKVADPGLKKALASLKAAMKAGGH